MAVLVVVVPDVGTPVEDAPVEDIPVEDAPVVDAPVVDAPVEDIPVDDTPPAVTVAPPPAPVVDDVEPVPLVPVVLVTPLPVVACAAPPEDGPAPDSGLEQAALRERVSVVATRIIDSFDLIMMTQIYRHRREPDFSRCRVSGALPKHDTQPERISEPTVRLATARAVRKPQRHGARPSSAAGVVPHVDGMRWPQRDERRQPEAVVGAEPTSQRAHQDIECQAQRRSAHFEHRP